ncbi:MAG: hypothetical protein PV344_05505, partial [Anaplasma sp.]|nr:hypothetical protein [Anaplasma sp.]
PTLKYWLICRIYNYFGTTAEEQKGEVFLLPSVNNSPAVLNIASDLEILWLIYRATPEAVILGVCYRPPHNDPSFSRKLNNILSQLVAEHPNAHILLFGDFNFPNIDWTNPMPVIASSAEANEFIEVCL